MSIIEFGTDANPMFTRLSGRMQVMAVALLLAATGIAIVGVLAGAPVSFPLMAVALATGLAGYWTGRAAAELREITTSSGQDVPHLLRAVQRLTQLYNLQLTILLAGLFVVLMTLAA